MQNFYKKKKILGFHLQVESPTQLEPQSFSPAQFLFTRKTHWHIPKDNKFPFGIPLGLGWIEV